MTSKWGAPLRNPNGKELEPPLFVDISITALTVLLVGFSIVMVYSTTGVVCQERFGDPLYYVKRQGAAAALGFVMLYLCSRMKLSVLKRSAPFMIVAVIALLSLPLLPGMGGAAGGATRWVGLGGVRFQPGEFAKLLFVIFMASYFSRHTATLERFSDGILKPFLYVAAAAAFFLLQPDFGSSAIIALVTFGMAAASGARFRHIALCLLAAIGAMAALVVISPYRLGRVVSFLSPFSDVKGKGYQLIQSLIAVGSGRVSGVGLGGSQQKLFFLPAAHTDFIFAVIAEELGLIGGLAVLLVFMIFLWRGLKLAGKFVGDTFAFSLAVGLTLLIAVPALVNMGVVVGLLPTKGLVLPLLAYGGSSLLASLMTVGLLLALARSFYE